MLPAVLLRVMMYLECLESDGSFHHGWQEFMKPPKEQN